jgi:hypothetical protein
MEKSPIAFNRSFKKNWFNTLNDALMSENLIVSWNFNGGIGYGETFTYHFDNGTKYGMFVSIYRDERGKYERPVNYNC